MNIGWLATMAVIGLAAGPVAAESMDDFDPDEILSVTQVPVGEMFRVERMDGNVFWVSGDRRWVFHGELTDMWTGLAEQDMPHHDLMDWRRTGMDLGDVSIGPPSERTQDGVLFFTREDEIGSGLESVLLQAERAFTLAPIAFDVDPARWQWIWCEFDGTASKLERWLRNSEPGAWCEDERASAALAFAQVFRMAGRTPAVIDRYGYIYYGEDEILKWLDTH